MTEPKLPEHGKSGPVRMLEPALSELSAAFAPGALQIVSDLVTGSRSRFKEMTPEVISSLTEGDVVVVAVFCHSQLLFCQGRGPGGGAGSVTFLALRDDLQDLYLDVVNRYAVSVYTAAYREGRLTYVSSE